MPVSFHNNDTNYRLPGGRTRAAAWLREVARREGKLCGQVAMIFCSDATLLDMNRQFLEHDYFTDVITFDYSVEGTIGSSEGDSPAGDTIGGDIYISVDTVARNAAIYGATPAREMLRVVVHGVLHLCGYGDKTAAEEKKMRAKEDEYLALYEKMNGK